VFHGDSAKAMSRGVGIPKNEEMDCWKFQDIVLTRKEIWSSMYKIRPFYMGSTCLVRSVLSKQMDISYFSIKNLRIQETLPGLSEHKSYSSIRKSKYKCSVEQEFRK
jgi:hypothetical protein